MDRVELLESARGSCGRFISAASLLNQYRIKDHVQRGDRRDRGEDKLHVTFVVLICV